MEAEELERRLEKARSFERSGQVLQAESQYLGVLKAWPRNLEAARRLAHFALMRGDGTRAIGLLRSAAQIEPSNAQLKVDLAVAHLASEQTTDAIRVLEGAVVDHPAFTVAWLLLGEVRDSIGDPSGALKAWNQAVTRSQRQGYWKNQETTPPHLLESVVKAIERLRRGRRDLFFGAYDALRRQYGGDELKRVDRALTGYLRDWDATPSDPRQRPKFFFFPDIPNQPYHDPYLQPWASTLQGAFPVIREEALGLLHEREPFQDFIEFKEGDAVEEVLTGDAKRPTWEAFFFYRHGDRFEENHRRCPKTSAVLESIELCRVEEQAPEVLFSVLQPGTHIMPHHGVTNTRLVMHLPLIVPPDCALNLVGAGEHHWKEGELVMFDDTYLHEAWNRSQQTRVIVLMDCWNPHLTAVEKRAVKQLIETISGLQLADRARPAAGATSAAA